MTSLLCHNMDDVIIQHNWVGMRCGGGAGVVHESAWVARHVWYTGNVERSCCFGMYIEFHFSSKSF